AVIDAYAHAERFRIAVGRAPQGLALSADGTQLYVHNFMDRTVTVHDLTALYTTGTPTAALAATYNTVGAEKLNPQVLTGKQLFYDAKDTRLARDNYISCASCHNDGGQDGRIWDLTGFGEGLRNTIALNGHTGQGPLHWSANFDEVQDFEGQIRNLSGGTGLLSDPDFAATSDPLGAAKAGRSADLDALAAYVNSLTTVGTSPHRNGDGSLTPAGEAGKAIFISANCAQCHSNQGFTDSAPNNLHDIGTLTAASGQRLNGPLIGLDTPTLRGLWRTAPYLHSGSAATLADAVNAHAGVALNTAELRDLVAFLVQIDDSAASAPVPNRAPTVTNPGAQAGLEGNVVTLALQANDSDGDLLTFVASGLPTGLAIADNSGVIAGTLGSAGVYDVAITVADGRGGVATINFTWTVTALPSGIQPGVYQLVNVGSNLCVDVNGGSTSNGARIIQWSCHTGNNQKWRVETVGTHYRLTAVHSNKVIDVYGGSTRAGAKLIQWSWHSGTNQQWTIRAVADGVYEIVSVKSSLCMDVTNGSTSRGTDLQQWTCNGSNAQRWRLIPQ
ncbi:MAG: RICIN domain-containing protein, partial [Caldilineaceae bacterium]|nr:RICIN domain-containing protein [Caldilineaceae bacterium]